MSIVDGVKQVAADLGAPAAQVALAWSLAHGDVTAPIIGARTPAQLDENLAAMTLSLDPEHLQRLDNVSSIEPGFPHALLSSKHIQIQIRGEMTIESMH